MYRRGEERDAGVSGMSPEDRESVPCRIRRCSGQQRLNDRLQLADLCFEGPVVHNQGRVLCMLFGNLRTQAIDIDTLADTSATMVVQVADGEFFLLGEMRFACLEHLDALLVLRQLFRERHDRAEELLLFVRERRVGVFEAADEEIVCCGGCCCAHGLWAVLAAVEVAAPWPRHGRDSRTPVRQGPDALSIQP
ncbi:hypothetical protein BC831DRAFT_451387 [Entophlyctis helioformis]|nr:hypothetical protein BC831DRAFT_451387 [Entophlyctis helioformis]